MEENPLASGPADLFARIDDAGFEENLPSEGPEALVDTTDNPVFGSAKVSA